MIRREQKKFDLNEAFFPVREQPVFLRSKVIPGYKAIVDVQHDRAISVVSSKYRLVQNREAYLLADYVVRAVFEGYTLSDFECFNVHMTQSKGSCRIDLIIPNNYNQLFGEEKESWLPFIRISNSYNRTIKLKFEIGFCRYICLNGVIFGQKGLSFSITHTGRIAVHEIDILIRRSKAEIGEIGSLWKSFEQKMVALKKIRMQLSFALPIFCKVFDITTNDDNENLPNNRILLIAKQVHKSSKEYFEELGDNAYAMMNVLTDYASFPEWTNHPAYLVDGYQKKVGKWVEEFIKEHNKEGFILSEYIGKKYIKTAEKLESILNKEIINKDKRLQILSE